MIQTKTLVAKTIPTNRKYKQPNSKKSEQEYRDRLKNTRKYYKRNGKTVQNEIENEVKAEKVIK